jgi:hypothetical protein
MPREVQSIKNKTGGIEHIRTSRFAFLLPAGICPREMLAGMRRRGPTAFRRSTATIPKSASL